MWWLPLATTGTINIIVSKTLHRSCTVFFFTVRAVYVYTTNGGLHVAGPTVYNADCQKELRMATIL